MKAEMVDPERIEIIATTQLEKHALLGWQDQRSTVEVREVDTVDGRQTRLTLRRA